MTKDEVRDVTDSMPRDMVADLVLNLLQIIEIETGNRVYVDTEGCVHMYPPRADFQG